MPPVALCRAGKQTCSNRISVVEKSQACKLLVLLLTSAVWFAGDFFADRDGPKFLPTRVGKKEGEKATDAQDKVKQLTEGAAPPPVKSLTYKDPFSQVYKKYIFTMDGKYLLGGMMIGDTRDYVKLVPMVKNQKALEVAPSELIVGAKKEGEEDGDDL